MQIVIDIPDKEVPNSQEIIDISLHFIAGEVCDCNYPYIVLPKNFEFNSYRNPIAWMPLPEPYKEEKVIK